MRKRLLSLFLAVVLIVTAVSPMAYAEGDTYEEEIMAQAVPGNPTECGEAGVAIIKASEGCVLTAYKAVPSEVYWTIGWGHYGKDVYPGMTITQEEADALLEADLEVFEAYVTTFLNKYNISVNQSQYDALVCFTYNFGNVWVSYDASEFRLKRYLIEGIENYTETEIREAFTAWCKAGGVVLQSLIRRRNAECDLFLSELHNPSNPWLESDKTVAKIGEEVEFTFGAENAEEYTVVVKRANDRAEEILTADTDTGSYTAVFDKSGYFTVYVICSNSSGVVNSSEIKLTVYGDFGDEFTSPIIHKEQDEYLGLDEDGIYIAEENGYADQMWYFDRQSDGTYIISSCYNGKFLTVVNGKVCAGSDSHKWYIWEESRGYVLSSKSTGKVLSLLDSVKTAAYDGLSPQIWELDIEEEVGPQKPQLNVILGNDRFETIINWSEGYGAKGHNLKIWKNKVSDAEPYLMITDVETAVEELLPLGTYQGYIEAYHEYGTTRSEIVTFTVTDDVIVKYNANGGENAPIQQQKADGKEINLSKAVPTRVGHAFANWNTAPDGSGKSYMPGDKYTANENVVLYAIWDPTSEVNGDINSDTVVSNADIILLARLLVGLETVDHLPVWINGDMNDDGVLTNADLVIMAKFIVKM